MKILSFVFPGFTFTDLAPMQAFMMLPEAKSQIVGQKKGIVASDAGVNVQTITGRPHARLPRRRRQSRRLGHERVYRLAVARGSWFAQGLQSRVALVHA